MCLVILDPEDLLTYKPIGFNTDGCPTSVPCIDKYMLQWKDT